MGGQTVQKGRGHTIVPFFRVKLRGVAQKYVREEGERGECTRSKYAADFVFV